MTRWREARDGSGPLPPADQAEPEGVTEAEVKASSERASVILAEMRE